MRGSAETSRRLACDASRVVMRHDEDGRVVEIGARTRTIPPPCGGRSPIGTGAAASRAAASASARGIISATGRTAARRRGRTSRFCAAGIIGRCTRRATRSRAGPTARSGSGARTAARCLRCHRLPRWSVIPSRLLCACHDSIGLHVDARTACACWLGERLDLTWAIDVLHPLAQRARPGRSSEPSSWPSAT